MDVAAMAGQLAVMGVLQRVPRTWQPLSSCLLGDINLLGTAYDAAGVSAEPSMSQIRECVTEYAIFPLGSEYVKQHVSASSVCSLPFFSSSSARLVTIYGYGFSRFFFFLFPRLSYSSSPRRLCSLLSRFAVTNRISSAVFIVVD